MRITAWRGFLAAGLVATAGYYLLPDTERVAAASSALYHYAAAVAVWSGSGCTGRPIPGPGT